MSNKCQQERIIIISSSIISIIISIIITETLKA